LTALIRTGQEKKANDLAAQWLREGQVEEPTPGAAARLSAALAHALGQGHDLYTNQIEERWLKPLADAALYLARREHGLADANRILNQYAFRQSDESRRVRQALASTLAAEVSRLTPAQVNYYVDWIAEPDFGAP